MSSLVQAFGIKPIAVGRNTPFEEGRSALAGEERSSAPAAINLNRVLGGSNPDTPKSQHNSAALIYNSLSCFTDQVELYRGRTSVVWSARCVRSGSTVVIKEYAKQKLKPRLLQNVQREIALLRFFRKAGCRGVVTLLANFEDHQSITLVFEACMRGDLYQLMTRQHGALSEEYVCSKVVVPLLSILAELHRLHIIHRDIKPENIFLATDGSIQLGDFGLAVNQLQDPLDERVGTLDYMAPEVLAMPIADPVSTLLLSSSGGQLGMQLPTSRSTSQLVQLGSPVRISSSGSMAALPSPQAGSPRFAASTTSASQVHLPYRMSPPTSQATSSAGSSASQHLLQPQLHLPFGHASASSSAASHAHTSILAAVAESQADAEEQRRRGATSGPLPTLPAIASVTLANRPASSCGAPTKSRGMSQRPPQLAVVAGAAPLQCSLSEVLAHDAAHPPPPYNEKVDVWAVGVLVYELLTGRAPFEVDDPRETARLILTSEVAAFPAAMSDECQDFITAALTKDPQYRPSAGELLRFPWVKSHLGGEPLPASMAASDKGLAFRMLKAWLQASWGRAPHSEGPRLSGTGLLDSAASRELAARNNNTTLALPKRAQLRRALSLGDGPLAGDKDDSFLFSHPPPRKAVPGVTLGQLTLDRPSSGTSRLTALALHSQSMHDPRRAVSEMGISMGRTLAGMLQQQSQQQQEQHGHSSSQQYPDLLQQTQQPPGFRAPHDVGEADAGVQEHEHGRALIGLSATPSVIGLRLGPSRLSDEGIPADNVSGTCGIATQHLPSPGAASSKKGSASRLPTNFSLASIQTVHSMHETACNGSAAIVGHSSESCPQLHSPAGHSDTHTHINTTVDPAPATALTTGPHHCTPSLTIRATSNNQSNSPVPGLSSGSSPRMASTPALPAIAEFHTCTAPAVDPPAPGMLAWQQGAVASAGGGLKKMAGPKSRFAS